MSQKENKAKLVEGDVGLTLIKLTLPMMVGMVGMVIFNLVDAFFIGKLGTEELAAMTFTLPIVLLQSSISMGLGVGASSVISRLIGQGNHEQVKRQTTDSLIFSVLIVIVFVTIGLMTIKPLFSLLGARGIILDYVRDYMSVWYCGVMFVVVPMIGNNAIRAAGNTVIPTIIMSTAIIINVIFDPLLIFGIGPFPRMGMKGAALATVFARATTLCLSLFILHHKFRMLTIKIPKLKELLHSWKEMLHVGIPAAITMLISPLSFGVVTKMIAVFGKEAVAALGVGNRIELFALSPLSALSSVLIPFIGQNIGAKRIERINKGLYFSQVLSFIIGLVMFFFFLIFKTEIALLFNKNQEVVDILGWYLVIVSASYGLLGIMFINASAFNALKKPINATIINFTRMFVLYIPLAYFFKNIWQVKGIFAGAFLSSVIVGIISLFWIKFELKQINKNYSNNRESS